MNSFLNASIGISHVVGVTLLKTYDDSNLFPIIDDFYVVWSALCTVSIFSLLL